MSQSNLVRVEVLLNGQTLAATETDTQAAASRVQVETDYANRVFLSCLYTTGSGETNNTCNITVWGYDGSNWRQIGTTANSSGTVTFTVSTFAITGASASVSYHAWFDIDPIGYKKIRIAASESGVATNFGTLTVVSLIQ